MSGISSSYITHQRRPAIIPAGVRLSPEDEQAVRMRTGCVNPLSHNELVFVDAMITTCQGGMIADASGEKTQGRESADEKGVGKRKASQDLEDQVEKYGH